VSLRSKGRACMTRRKWSFGTHGSNRGNFDKKWHTRKKKRERGMIALSLWTKLACPNHMKRGLMTKGMQRRSGCPLWIQINGYNTIAS